MSLLLFPIFAEAEDEKYRDTSHPAVELSQHQIETSGLQVILLRKGKHQAEFRAFGTALDLMPLLDLRSEYLHQTAELTIAEARLKLAREGYSRVSNLHRNDAISKRKMQVQAAQLEEAKARHQAISHKIRSLEEAALLDWGEILSRWAFNFHSVEFNHLVTGQRTLLRITLPPGRELPPDTQKILVSQNGSRKDAVPVDYVSPAEETDSEFQGETFFFISPEKFQTGAHITAWVSNTETWTGVFIPFSAVIRHLGESYIYFQTGATEFTRHPLTEMHLTPDGYFIRDTRIAGSELVTTGAQMLLSEEFRGQIPDEDDD